MTISRGQMPRQMYGLGSLVKSITKGVKSAVSGVKDVLGSDLGKAALLGIGAFGLPTAAGQRIFSGFAPDFLRTAGMDFLKGDTAKKIGGVLKDVAVGTGVAGITDYLTRPDQAPASIGGRSQQEIGEVINLMKENYRNLGYSEGEIDMLIEDYVQQNYPGYANGGRIGYAFGNPEQNAINAAGIMGLSLNQNPAGVTELDLRDSGGFIPPVGVKEKADDIPAMLSNNEFVFTADAVKGMGDGDVNKGAQRMYDMMKKLEKGGRV